MWPASRRPGGAAAEFWWRGREPGAIMRWRARLQPEPARRLAATNGGWSHGTAETTQPPDSGPPDRGGDDRAGRRRGRAERAPGRGRGRPRGPARRVLVRDRQPDGLDHRVRAVQGAGDRRFLR